MNEVYIAILLLTILDAFCTWFGVSNGFIAEGNPIVNWLSTSASMLLMGIAAVVLTGSLLLFIRSVQKQRNHKWISYLVLGVLLIKIAVAGTHVYWISILAFNGLL